jgi:crotonobetainyl-CoA:carnitine CoA-transferase CaiB-like acyl-CoA transferase
MTSAPSSASWPLDGVRVLDATVGIPGGYATKLLADAGADVVKVEPEHGDPLRRQGALFAFLNASKRSVQAGGRAAESSSVDKLVDGADIVVMDDEVDLLGRSAEAISSRHSGAAVVVLSWFGAYGPWAGRAANEFTLQGWCGSIASRGRKDQPPLAAGGRIGEWAAGSVAALSALALLRGSRLTGKGGVADVSILEVMTLAFNQYQAVSVQLDGRGPTPALIPRIVDVPAIEPTRDGWIGIATVRSAHFAAFAKLIRRPEWATDPDISRFDRRTELIDQLAPVVEAWTRERTTAEIVEAAGSAHIPVAPIGNGETLPTIGYVRERRLLVETADGQGVQPRIPYTLEGLPQRPFEPAPELGAHRSFGWPSRTTRAPERDRGADIHASLPCTGLRVFDFTSTWAGPYASQILGFLGADVIKVESVQRPDGTRLSTAFASRGDRPWELTPIFHGVNTTKRGVTLDLARPEGRDLARRLIAICDVVVENYTPRVAEQFGLLDDDPDSRLITLRMPAWGLGGEWRDRPGFAQTMEQVTGLAWVTGRIDGPPIAPRGPCDPIGAWHAAFAVLAALDVRDRTGRGTLIEAPLLESALNIAAEQVVEFSTEGHLITRMGNRSRFASPQNVYATSGTERWLALSIETDRQWEALTHALGDPEWARDRELNHAAGRRAHEDEIDRRLAEIFDQAELDDVVRRLWSAGVPVAPVVDPRRVLENEQLVARCFFEPVEHDVAGSIRLPRFPAIWSTRTSPWHWRPAPTLGQHTAEVLVDELGVPSEDLEHLEREHIIGTRPV